MATRTRSASRSRPQGLQLRISLLDSRPLVWRSVVVPETIKLPKLHQVIQAVMGWHDSHLHEFVFSTGHYGEPTEFDEPGSVHPEAKVALNKVLGGGWNTFQYQYDFGDDWQHLVQVEDVLPPANENGSAVRCLAGANACPPEDVGGLIGYAEFLQALADPKHEEHESMLEWIGGPFDPRRFDLDAVNVRLARVRV